MNVLKEIVNEPGHYIFEWRTKAPLTWSGNFFLWSSPTFTFLNETWHFKFIKHQEYLYLHLIRDVPCQLDFPVCITLLLKAADGTLLKSTSVFHCFRTEGSCFVWPRIVKSEKYVRQGCQLIDANEMIIVSCDLSLYEKSQADPQSQTFLHDDTATLSQNLAEMYMKQQQCDVTICVHDRQVQAHRSILAARSTVFASMFEHDMKEKNSGVIEIDDCDPNAFHYFMLYLYTGKVDMISPKDAIALYCIADKYDTSQLALSCEQFLLTNLSAELFCDILVLAIKYNKSALMKAVEDFFATHIEEILVTEKWKQFLEENSLAANELYLKCAQTFKRRRICL